jgi:hypothetical protein
LPPLDEWRRSALKENHLAGHTLWSLDATGFATFVTSPTAEALASIAKPFRSELKYILEDYEGEDDDIAPTGKLWRQPMEKFCETLKLLLTAPSWCNGFTPGDVEIWNLLIHCMVDKAGKKIGLDPKIESSIYFDVPNLALKHGATLMSESHFGMGGFRCERDNVSGDQYFSIFPPDRLKELKEQLDTAAKKIKNSTDKESVENRFHTDLCAVVTSILTRNRTLIVLTDT